VNIGLVNEIAMMSDALGNRRVGSHRRGGDEAVRVHAVLFRAPAFGGHCIPIDPFYLSWKAKQSGFDARFIELAGQINGHMPEYVLSRVSEALNGHRKAVNVRARSRPGVAYKRDIDDVRESPGARRDETAARQGRGGRVRRPARAVSRLVDVAWTTRAAVHRT